MTDLQLAGWAIYWLAALVTLAEALNKLERTSPLRPGLGPRERLTVTLKAIAWGLLAIGSAGVLASPLVASAPPGADAICYALGFAVLIVRTRVKEG